MCLSLTGTYESGGWPADVVVVGIALDGVGRDVVEQARHQTSQDVPPALPVQKVDLASASSAMWRVRHHEAGQPRCRGCLRLVPAQLHLALLHTLHVQARGGQQIWEYVVLHRHRFCAQIVY